MNGDGGILAASSFPEIKMLRVEEMLARACTHLVNYSGPKSTITQRGAPSVFLNLFFTTFLSGVGPAVGIYCPAA